MNVTNAERVRGKFAGFTITELIIATGLSSIVGAMILSFTVFSSRAFCGMTNYVDLDVHSRNALDMISREMRQATALSACVTNAATNYVIATNTSAQTYLKVTWDTNAGTLLFEKTGQPPMTILTGCDAWGVALYTRAPSVSSTNLSFNLATNIADCKVVNMTWKCSRTVLGSKVDTESVQTAQIVLRNKVR
jgi:Tfp pilus assembly protein PilW